MKDKWKVFFSNLKALKWKNLLLFAIACFYIGLVVVWVGERDSPIQYGGDFLGYWSVGKIADEKGYSEIHDIDNLRIVETQELKALGFLGNTSDSSLSPPTAHYLSFYIVPFQLLSKLELKTSFWVWTLFNLAILIGYLVFYLRKVLPGNVVTNSGLSLLFLVLVSFPVFNNLVNGQVNIFLLVCVGEMIRNAVKKKPLLSGLWMGGLLLKPVLLILIIPIFLIMRNWKVLLGFIVSSGMILTTSLILSGFTGMSALFNAWTKFGENSSLIGPGSMINWRMIGVNLNLLLNTPFGWVITGMGIVLTTLTVFFLIKQCPPYGRPSWVLIMLGVFAATLAITWHSHAHMAMVMIPFLVYVSLHKLLPEKIIFLWVLITPVSWIVIILMGSFLRNSDTFSILEYQGMVIALSGFIGNLAILVSTVLNVNSRKLKLELKSEGVSF